MKKKTPEKLPEKTRLRFEKIVLQKFKKANEEKIKSFSDDLILGIVSGEIGI
ncbi:MAG: hypothetical protein L6Q54_11445 [Leptospiraceae bacterium]|nr:hypothetical protein [Leptospiraceae bacterium]MCK6381842.1 hypothetical protein [Leptospiraceae bacterium]NUM42603.1 hypothetical protein [Leptospiraceae bacterium]